MGRPKRPAHPISDVRPWRYTGNKFHPTEKAVEIINPLIKAYSKPRDVVIDPFAASGSTAVAAALTGRAFIGVEWEERYCAHAQRRLAGVRRMAGDDDDPLKPTGPHRNDAAAHARTIDTFVDA